ncbi:NAD(P)H-hydrate dehydratase [Massilia solisilvae]|uniref:Bifunctional NAD(P)H-hydrate repair enzyme n=1 Tax=Massilia solisilvae TaxID=1811225 RepID=A0ABT2BHZ2_9BURK|nr:NAD(P)H-hydrate dehydratase [Massilia solisilvae]MCS0608139.1 NAD(P)H-hydrate dehydratase [Massilia solisilvae]
MDNLLYSVESIRAIEHAAAAALGEGVLMQRAGQAAARFALDLLGEHRKLPVLLVAGPGNNGGDALETAANLREAGVEALVLYLPGEAAPSAETARALARAQASGVRFIDALPDHAQLGLVVDGLFGIGLARQLQGRHAELALRLDTFGCPVLALDVPSGLDADTGAVVGVNDDRVAVSATHTITFIGDKPGLHTCDGRDHAGIVRVDDLGIERHHFVAPDARLNAVDMFASDLALARRPQNTHKGSFGDVVIVGGAHGMAGAPVLAARAALLAGAGRVFVAALDPGLAYDSVHPELMFRDAVSFDFSGRTVVAGPGMGDAPAARRLLFKVIDSDSPLVLDADALNQLAGDADLQGKLAQRKAPTVLTPHPLEAARLLGVTSAVVQADRVEAARELAGRFDATIVLKGSGTVIAENEANGVAINTTGNPGLATAGTGDVLSGVCGALLTQGWSAGTAALGAVWMHGAAADALVEQGIGPIGLTAGELPGAIRSILNRLVREATVR